MKKKFNISFSLVVALGLLIFIPIIASADPISWTSGTYRAYAYAINQEFFGPIYGEDSEENLSPPLSMPIEASAYVETWVSYLSWQYIHGDAYSSVSTSSFYTFADASSWCCEESVAHAVASFTGTFTASDPYFEFNYELTSSYTDWGFWPYTPSYDGWLTVTDLTNSTTLINLALNDGSDAIFVPLLSGHDIEVSFGIEAISSPPCCNKSAATQEATLSFSTAVVPEPISSILFVTGGTLLVVRRYLRRK